MPDPQRPVARDRAALLHRRLLVVVGLLLVATIVGMVALWPRAERLPEAQAAPEDLVTARILEVQLSHGEADPMIGLSGETVRVTLELLEGPEQGTVVTLADIPTDGYPDFRVGDRVELAPTDVPGSEVGYFITDFQRLPTLWILLGVFVLAVLAVGRWHGLRSLLGLALSLLIVVRFIVPAILSGQSPPLVALVGALAVMIVTLYLTHGVTEMTTAAVVGTAAALTLTVALGLLFIDRGRITGFASDDAVFARLAVDGLDLRGLVLAGLIIAALGVLDDVTISQSSTVFALHDTDPTLTWTALFARAMRVGRDHIASVVNTLFLAYAGASLALFVLFSTGGLRVAEILNSEVLAEEIVKTVVGSIGLIAAVPLTTALASAVALQRAPGVAGVTRPGPGPVPGEVGAERDDHDLDDDERAARAWARYLAARADDPEPGTPPGGAR